MEIVVSGTQEACNTYNKIEGPTEEIKVLKHKLAQLLKVAESIQDKYLTPFYLLFS